MTMQFLIEMLSGLIAILAAAALSQFGVDLHTPRPVEPEIERVQTCMTAPSASVVVKTSNPC